MYSLGKNYTENLDKRRLLTSDELRRLKEGETVVVRVIKRSDNDRNSIVPNPIFNEGEHRMKYRYEYLGDTFDNSKSFIDVKVETLHKDVDTEKLVFSCKEESKNEIDQQIEDKVKKAEELKDRNLDISECDEIEKYIDVAEEFTFNGESNIYEEFIPNIEDLQNLDEMNCNKDENIDTLQTEQSLEEQEKKSLIDLLARMNLIGIDEEEIILNSTSIYDIYSQIDDDEIIDQVKSFVKK